MTRFRPQKKDMPTEGIDFKCEMTGEFWIKVDKEVQLEEPENTSEISWVLTIWYAVYERSCRECMSEENMNIVFSSKKGSFTYSF